MKAKLITVAIIAVGLIGGTYDMNPDNLRKEAAQTQPSSVANWHYDGEVLYPNRVHDDTLVVIRANMLNKMLRDNFDGNLLKLYRQTTESLNGRVLDLPEEYSQSNKLDDLSTMITPDSIHIWFQ